MTPLARMRARLKREELAEARRVWETPLSAEELEAIQLDTLNQSWQRTCETVPHYQDLLASGGVPASFTSLDEFASIAPVTTKDALRAGLHEMTSTERRPDLTRMTGGSTAKPLQFPAWKSELERVVTAMWMARGWFGVTPASTLFHLWGHSHLLGEGLKGWVNARRRMVTDRFLGYLRFSAYDLQPKAMERAVDRLIRFQPDYVMGYSVALDRLARAALPRREETRRLGIKVVIATAEGFPSPDSPALLEECFACPVAMEYGAVESGVIAHTHPEGGYRVFWRSNLVECDPRDDGAGPLRITSLEPRCLPLVRYEIGDELALDSAHGRTIGIERFARVLGRCNDYIELSGGMQVHSEAVSHAVRPCAALLGYQVIQRGHRIRLRYTSEESLSKTDTEPIRTRLAKIHPELTSIEFERVPSLEQTVAGKTRMIVRE